MRFRFAHATHPDGGTAVELCLLQLARQAGDGPSQRRPNLGFVYLTDVLAPQAEAILALLKLRTGVANWVGASAAAVCATGAEYVDEPALAIMLGRFAPGSFNVFSGTQRPPAPGTRTDRSEVAASTALVHADPDAPELPELIVDMAQKVDSGRLFGGLASGREPRLTIADRVLRGGLSGAVFAASVPIVSRVTQGCHPLPGSRRHTITGCGANRVDTLDDERAVDVLLRETGLVEPAVAPGTGPRPTEGRAREAHKVLKALGRQGLIFAGIEPGRGAAAEPRRPGEQYLVRPVVAIDASSGTVAIGAPVERGYSLRFCSRDETAARKDLTRICSEIRDELHERSEQQRRPVQARGAVYVSCIGRGTHLFGEPHEELRLIARQLGDVPLVGFYADGEISGRSLYGYTGVLTVFC
jgi:small ligand-binding sensory domain FIST